MTTAEQQRPRIFVTSKTDEARQRQAIENSKRHQQNWLQAEAARKQRKLDQTTSLQHSNAPNGLVRSQSAVPVQNSSQTNRNMAFSQTAQSRSRSAMDRPSRAYRNTPVPEIIVTSPQSTVSQHSQVRGGAVPDLSGVMTTVWTQPVLFEGSLQQTDDTEQKSRAGNRSADNHRTPVYSSRAQEWGTVGISSPALYAPQPQRPPPLILQSDMYTSQAQRLENLRHFLGQSGSRPDVLIPGQRDPSASFSPEYCIDSELHFPHSVTQFAHPICHMPNDRYRPINSSAQRYHSPSPEQRPGYPTPPPATPAQQRPHYTKQASPTNDSRTPRNNYPPTQPTTPTHYTTHHEPSANPTQPISSPATHLHNINQTASTLHPPSKHIAQPPSQHIPEPVHGRTPPPRPLSLHLPLPLHADPKIKRHLTPDLPMATTAKVNVERRARSATPSVLPKTRVLTDGRGRYVGRTR
ncbi:hypothetical protein P153DRAFT_384097 [Dothidotthia symphoricarpi CBS 119687]|uniref:Uncharacterized protein n=1 Tax=Dothidotthia symphoricarpi CBS 119687 TaxID=1392245 RepID=A0A6A6AIG7_9PLEO|nr:uncharacterized protein P153DRAFT_384097 [Dothidotthia symphoricarpi CBS 119687]KAF2130878.1 hypothetical protein P153DRAFT_384097 [Dothidotthia symphoricarpi CBS 119687]